MLKDGAIHEGKDSCWPLQGFKKTNPQFLPDGAIGGHSGITATF